MNIPVIPSFSFSSAKSSMPAPSFPQLSPPQSSQPLFYFGKGDEGGDVIDFPLGGRRGKPQKPGQIGSVKAFQSRKTPSEILSILADALSEEKPAKIALPYLKRAEVLKALETEKSERQHPLAMLLLFAITKSPEPQSPEAIRILGQLNCVKKNINKGRLYKVEPITFNSPTVIIALVKEAFIYKGKANALSENLKALLQIRGIEDLPYRQDVSGRKVRDPETSSTGLALARRRSKQLTRIVELLEAFHSK